jgi:hypothetical protein
MASRVQLTFREDAFGIDAGFAYLNGGAFFLKARPGPRFDHPRPF